MRLLVLAASILALAGCGALARAGVGLVYDTADLPEANVRRDVAYLPDGDPSTASTSSCPSPTRSVAGPCRPSSSSTAATGTRATATSMFGGRDIYNNIGRYLAGHGVGAAVVSYRLMPAVTWRDQVRDVARGRGLRRGPCRRVGRHARARP